ncbi:MAG TPA: class I SAM-dependent DNA methyltransferase [Pyrinomonadaceae bacterium]|nr:class I SAM-dependent DNA methyltransferase [Pyrinomonadaceae bacterium]
MAKTKTPVTLTTAQQLGSIVKSARDIMRKDKGLNGDLDRLPMLTWIMFLKFLDDMEHIREQESTMAGTRFRAAIEPPYRWRDWAAISDGITGDELIAFVNNEEAVRPDGTKGAGLFAYLRSLQGANGGDRRDVIATVFKGTINRMINGYLLRDVINKINGIHFTSSEEIHVLGSLYESMLKEMRDAAGDSGEFYTPRAVVRFMVAVTNPQLGEKVLDPATGTGGFLVESFVHIKRQCKTVKDERMLQKESILGCEPKPLPYLLSQMNLLLHGLESPKIDPNNALAVRITEIGDKDRVDVVLTNPPFGGEEEKGIQGNFPEDKRTAETALLFLQLIMRKLRRQQKPGRAAVITPNGTLFGDGVCGRIKEELLKEFNLHTIIRLPDGVFAPYTGIPTNILFFDRSGPTGDVWFYEQPLPEGRKNYTKTAPIQFDEFTGCISWWEDRHESEQAWKWDFKKEFDEAVTNASPYWARAEAERKRGAMLNQQVKELARTIDDLLKSKPTEAKKLAAKRSALLTDAQSAEIKAREEQKAGDDIYWPIFNLDHKNPHLKEDITHLPPEQIAADILNKEQRIAEIMSNIQHLLAKGNQ